MANIVQSLAELKRKKAELVRLVGVRRDSFSVYKGEAPEVGFDDVSAQIKVKSDDIDVLKVKLHAANVNTKVDSAPLYTYVIRQASVRSELSNLQALLGSSEDRWMVRDETKENRKVPQVGKLDLNKRIVLLEEEKARLDAIIQKANFETGV